MATLSGHRTAARGAAAAAALFCAALTVGASPAHAAPSNGPTITFSGGSVLSLLVCKSEPSVSRVSVPAESRVTFVNRLGQPATLTIDGEATKKIGADQAVPVVFHRGPVTVGMTFDCGVGVVEEFQAVSVAVTPPPAEGSPGNLPAAGANATPTRSTGTATGAQPQRRPSTREDSDPEADPEDEADAVPMGTASAEPPAAGPPVVSTSAAPAVALEPIVPADAPARRGAAGLLALVASVCVVGVGIAAIRAIMAQRTSRASFA
jgi:hypothetical protein